MPLISRTLYSVQDRFGEPRPSVDLDWGVTFGCLWIGANILHGDIRNASMTTLLTNGILKKKQGNKNKTRGTSFVCHTRYTLLSRTPLNMSRPLNVEHKK